MAVPDENEFTSPELFDAHAHVWNHIFKFMIPMSLKCAVELGIPDIIKNHGKPMTLSELASALHINKAKSHCLHRLMRLLVDSKFFVKVDIEDENKQEEGYWLTPSSNLLLKGSSFVTPFLLLVLDPIMMKSFHSMSEWFADDHVTAFETAHGSIMWEKVRTDGRLNKLMNNEGVERHSRFESCIILKDREKLFSGVESMVDIGGGTGTIAKAVAEAFPEMKCTVLDLPHVVAGLEGVANLNYVGGNMFETIPSADVVLIKGVLHNWNDEGCIKILKKCKDAIPGKEKGGKVIVIDMVLGHDQENNTVKENKLFHDILMMAYVNGEERSEKEWEKLFLDAGFSSYKITPTLGLISIIEVYP